MSQLSFQRKQESMDKKNGFRIKCGMTKSVVTILQLQDFNLLFNNKQF